MTAANSTLQTWPITELRARATSASDAVKSIKVYSGIGYQGAKGALVLDIRRNESGRFPESNFDYLERHDGEYTAIFQPTKEVMFLEAAPIKNAYRMPFEFSMNGPAQAEPMNAYKNYNPQQLINKILELERKLVEIEEDRNELLAELEEVNTVTGKLQHVANGVFERYIFPMFSEQKTTQQPLNYGNMAGEDWTKFPISNNPDQAIQDALEVLLSAFGNDALIRIAKKLQQNPNLVNTLTNML